MEEMLTLEKFEEATEIVHQVTRETKLLYSKVFSDRYGNKIYLKPENMQYTGAYKQELEDALDLAIGEGTAANSLASKIKKYLQDPDKFYRRFRYKVGEETESLYIHSNGNVGSGVKMISRISGLTAIRENTIQGEVFTGQAQGMLRGLQGQKQT